MCELVWGELGTFVKKLCVPFGENTPFILGSSRGSHNYPSPYYTPSYSLCRNIQYVNCCAFAFSQSILSWTRAFEARIMAGHLGPERGSGVSLPGDDVVSQGTTDHDVERTRAQKAWCVHCALACLPALRVLALPVYCPLSPSPPLFYRYRFSV